MGAGKYKTDLFAEILALILLIIYIIFKKASKI